MSQELHYTSVPRGLKPGSRGFCTVGLTPHMPGPLVDRLEALSGYQPVFPPHDASAALNPIVFSHLRLTVSGKMVSVLSRIGPAGLDYSGRPNKYAHHIVLDGTERPEGGPAWLLSQPGFMQGAWDGEPREIPAGRTPPQGDRLPGVARAWQALIGDGGWAGVLAEAFLADPRRTVFLVFRPGMDLLPLFVEALALLPASRRWDVDFSTYFNQLPQGVGCAWRGVLEGSEHAKNAGQLPNALVVDLCRALGRAEGGVLAHLARTGERIVLEPGVTTASPGSGRHIPRMPQGPAASADDSPGNTAAMQPRSTRGNYELLPELARLVPGAGPPIPAAMSERNQRQPKPPWVLVVFLISVCVIPLILGGYFLSAVSVRELLGSNPEVAAERARVTEEKKISEAEAVKKEPQPEMAPPKHDDSEAAKSAEKQRELPPIVASELRKKAEGVLTSVVGVLMSLKRTAKKGTRTEEPTILLFPLPSIQKSGFGGKSAAEPKPFQLQDPSDQIALKYYVDDFDVKSVGDKDRIEIWTKSASEYGKLRLALFTKKAGELYFNWSEGARQSEKQAEILRDGILKIIAKNAHPYYILLRDSNIDDERPLSLSPRTQKLMSDDLKPRNLALEWIRNGSLVGTKWPLGIRKWKISSKLPNGQPSRVIAFGDEPTLPATVRKAVIPGEASVRLEIDTKNKEPHTIKVTLDFVKEAVIRRRRGTQRLVQLENQKQKTNVEYEEMMKLKVMLANIDDIMDIERHLLPPSHAELSVIIGLRIDDSTILNIAKFGEFAASPH